MSQAIDLVRVRRLVSTGVAREVRQEAGLSLAEMANAVGVHRMTVHKWERGRHRPKGDAALRYAHVLDELMQR
ncbi:hypothetical protein BH20ACT21_BH20ACT21_25280 [soil metagenome]